MKSSFFDQILSEESAEEGLNVDSPTHSLILRKSKSPLTRAGSARGFILGGLLGLILLGGWEKDTLAIKGMSFKPVKSFGSSVRSSMNNFGKTVQSTFKRPTPPPKPAPVMQQPVAQPGAQPAATSQAGTGGNGKVSGQAQGQAGQQGNTGAAGGQGGQGSNRAGTQQGVPNGPGGKNVGRAGAPDASGGAPGQGQNIGRSTQASQQGAPPPLVRGKAVKNLTLPSNQRAQSSRNFSSTVRSFGPSVRLPNMNLRSSLAGLMSKANSNMRALASKMSLRGGSSRVGAAPVGQTQGLSAGAKPGGKGLGNNVTQPGATTSSATKATNQTTTQMAGTNSQNRSSPAGTGGVGGGKSPVEKASSAAPAGGTKGTGGKDGSKQASTTATTAGTKGTGGKEGSEQAFTAATAGGTKGTGGKEEGKQASSAGSGGKDSGKEVAANNGAEKNKNKSNNDDGDGSLSDDGEKNQNPNAMDTSLKMNLGMSTLQAATGLGATLAQQSQADKDAEKARREQQASQGGLGGGVH